MTAVLLGGWGDLAARAVERASMSTGVTVVRTGAFSLAFTAGSLEEGATGGTRCWLAGHLVDAEAVAAQLGLAPDTPAPVLVAGAHARFGTGAAVMLHGVYTAIVAGDGVRRVVVHRDLLGARGVVFHHHHDGGLVFASHLVQLVGALPATPAPARSALVQWIDRQSLPPGGTLLEGVQRLGIGRHLDLSAARCAEVEHWRPLLQPLRRDGRDELIGRLRDAAFGAVRRSAVGAEHPGVRLSGGLDSACVAAGLREARRNGDAVAIGAIFPDHPEVDESSLIEATAAHVGLPLITVPFAGGEPLAPALSYVDRWLLPPASPNDFIWDGFHARARQAGIDVLLDGEGGDEAFGLDIYHLADLVRRGQWLSAWQTAARVPRPAGRMALSTRLRVLRAYAISGVVPHAVQRRRRSSRDPASLAGPLVQRRDVPALEEHDDPWAWKALDGPLSCRAAAQSFFFDAERIDANGHLWRRAIDSKVESRHPFLHDVRLVDELLRAPPGELFDPLRDRPLLRDALVGRIPEVVRNRHAKSYFTSVLDTALGGEAGERLRAHMARPGSPLREFVRVQGLDELLAAGETEVTSGRALFHLAMVDHWLQRVGV